MLLFPLLTAILLSARAVLLATAATPPSELSWRHRLQARRENIVKQLQEGSHRLRARASPAPCETSGWIFLDSYSYSIDSTDRDSRPSPVI